MDKHTLDVLNFPRILELLAQGAQSPQGRDMCRALAPWGRREQAEKALGELQALSELEPIAGFPPTAGIHRIEGAVEAASVDGACLDVETFLQIRETLEVCNNLLGYLEDAEAESSPLGIYAAQMASLDELRDQFERTFSVRGEVLDTASSTLQTIRSDLRRLRERILKILEGILRNIDLEAVVQDDFVTSRGDRYVIPLRTDFRGHLDGIIHDRSRTGATFFVEPLAVVELNNRLSLLREEEETEIRRILVGLTRSVGREASRVLRNLSVAAYLDALGARLVLAQKLGCARPEVVDEPCLDLRGARHPLLQVQEGIEVIPVDVRLGGGTRLLLVTGANAGGKTVALKTAGLLTLMARAGLFVPAEEGSRIGWFRDVYADIGDEQDIDRNLSTFSAHISHLRDILERAGEGTLALLDELGTGTDPTEGAALAQAVSEALLNAGVSVIATTHLASLKAFAYSRRDGRNAAVAFDPQSGKPLFRLDYGYAGASNALDVAERLGLPTAVLARARAFATAGSDAAAELLWEIERVKRAALEDATEAKRVRAEWERKIAEQEALVDAAQGEREAARLEARREAKAAMEEIRAELRRTIAGFARREATQQAAERAVGDAEKRLDQVLGPDRQESSARPAESVGVGSRVLVPSVGREGVVEALDPEGRKAMVRVGTLRVTVPQSDLQESQTKVREGSALSSRTMRPEVQRPPTDLVVIGCTIEEAIGRVDNALDQALLSGQGGFRVVHGRGTGALRRAIRDHLSADRHVRSVGPAGGDDASTWVELE